MKELLQNRKIYKAISLIIFPCLSLILAVAITAENREVWFNEQAVMYTYLKNTREEKDSVNCFNIETGNKISFTGLEPGDILLGGYPYCPYGRFSHAGIYIGENKVIEGYGDLGINIQDIRHYWNYSEVCLMRVNVEPKIKRDAVEYVKQQEGKIFYPLAFKSGERYWNCSKIMWKAYAEQGIDLAPLHDFWIAPDSYYSSPLLSIIREEGREK